MITTPSAVHVDDRDLVRAVAGQRESEAGAEHAALAGERLHDVVGELVHGVADVAGAVGLGVTAVSPRATTKTRPSSAPADAFILTTACAPTCVHNADENAQPLGLQLGGETTPGSSTRNSPVTSMSFESVSTAPGRSASPSARGTATLSISTRRSQLGIRGGGDPRRRAWSGLRGAGHEGRRQQGRGHRSPSRSSASRFTDMAPRVIPWMPEDDYFLHAT